MKWTAAFENNNNTNGCSAIAAREKERGLY